MALNADIIQQSRTLLQWLLSRFYGLKEHNDNIFN